MTVTEYTQVTFEQLSRSTVRVPYDTHDRYPAFRHGRDEIDQLEKSILALAYEVYINTFDPNADRETLLSTFTIRGFQIPGQGHRTHFHRIVLATREPGCMVVCGAPHAELEGAHRLLYDALIAWRDNAKRSFHGRAEWLELSYEAIFEWDGEFAMGTRALMLGEQPGDGTLWMPRDGHRQGFRSPMEFDDYMHALQRSDRASGRGRRDERRRPVRREPARMTGHDDSVMEGWRRILQEDR